MKNISICHLLVMIFFMSVSSCVTGVREPVELIPKTSSKLIFEGELNFERGQFPSKLPTFKYTAKNGRTLESNFPASAAVMQALLNESNFDHSEVKLWDVVQLAFGGYASKVPTGSNFKSSKKVSSMLFVDGLGQYGKSILRRMSLGIFIN